MKKILTNNKELLEKYGETHFKLYVAINNEPITLSKKEAQEFRRADLKAISNIFVHYINLNKYGDLERTTYKLTKSEFLKWRNI